MGEVVGERTEGLLCLVRLPKFPGSGELEPWGSGVCENRRGSSYEFIGT